MALPIQKARRFHRKRCRWTIVLCLIVHSSCIYFPNFCFKLPMFHSYFRFLYKGIIIKHNKTEPTYTKTSLFLCEKRRFFMARTEKGVVATI